MSRLVHLGLDVGGTASRWVACDDGGEVLARGQAGGATGHIFNPAEKERLSLALGAIGKSLAEAGLAAKSLTAGITGYGSAVAVDVKGLAGQVLGIEPDAITIMDDIVLAYVANFAPGEGHLVAAGTGSVGLHIAQDGSFVRVGGRGILIDDAGSGSWIALKALDQIYRILDHTGSFAGAEALAEQMFAEIGGNRWHDVRQFIYAGDRGRIGSLAVAVARAAEAGDETALAILRQAGGELAELAKAMLSRVGERPIRFVGGVLQLHPVILGEINRCLDRHAVRSANADAALAAAQLRAGRHQAWNEVLAVTSSLA
ncbi:BadF/BadG/BcrA/BcrD ATPase family protein [Pelagibacterium sp. H642]|uniref:N-acetylglucosamine kinase n=1 Tax=Pelagibacterium sp. H642 TaxID=1881069 RepID=UPI002816538C|nr:BadF/BadG/BcrA/BcrD ATPase family protein [Pelagibacterium sp. H642]WMT89546.1 hypothetical protein NO934_12150 [Pelagibacterium sp. H642]